MSRGRGPSAIAFVFALAFVASGCLNSATLAPASTPAKSLKADWFEAALAHDTAHDHADLAQHENLSTPNFHLLGYDPLITDHFGGKPAYGYGCGGFATRADGRTLDVVSAFQNDLTFVLVDVTDAAKPQKIGEFYSKGLGSYDADLTPDGKYVVLAFDQLTRVPTPPPGVAAASGVTLGFRSTCGGDVQFQLPDLAVTQGIVLISVEDPAHPMYVDWDPTPERNLHSVATARVDNVTWVIGSILGGVSRPGPLSTLPVSTGYHGLSYFVFDQIQSTPLGTKLVRVSQYETPPVTVGGGAPVTVPIRNGHTDVSMLKHPADKKTYAYIADWEGGVLIVDFTNPRVPMLTGQWVPPHPVTVYPNGDGPCYRSAIHEVLATETLWEGKHYLFAGQECPMKTDTSAPGGSVFVLDDTDPANIKLVGSWHLPAETGVWTVQYQASPHYLALVDRTLFISDYHAGVWAADVSTPEKMKAPPSIGVYLPAIRSPVMPEKTDTIPTDEQVDALPNGAIVITEDTTGLYVVKFDANDPAPPAAPFPYKST